MIDTPGLTRRRRSRLGLALALLASSAATGLAQNPSASLPGFGDLAGGFAEDTSSEATSFGNLRAVFDGLPGEVTRPERVRLLTENSEAWAARWQVMAQAERSLDAAYYIFDDDVFSLAMFGHLLKRAIDGVSVRVLVDTNGSMWFSKELRGRQILRSLAKAPSARVRYYKPLRKGLKNAIARHSAFDAICSNHDKILVGDRELAITGGRNIATDYFADPRDKLDAYRDTDLVMQGSDGAAGLGLAFEREWVAEDNTEVEDNKVLPDMVDYHHALILTWKAMDLYLHDQPFEEDRATLLASEGPAAEEAREFEAELLMRRALRWYQDDGEAAPYRQKRSVTLPLVGRLAYGSSTPTERDQHGLASQGVAGYLRALLRLPRLRGAAQRPLEEGMIAGAEIRILDRTSLAKGERGVDELTPSLAALIGAAQQSLTMDNPYVVLTEPSLRALADASDRGVEISLLTNSPESTDSKLTQAYFVKTWPEVLAHVPNLRTYVLAKQRKLHSKSAVVDGVLSLIGTYNLDLVSEAVNSEVVAAVWSRDFAAQHSAAQRADIEGGMAEEPRGVIEYRIDRDPETRAARRGADGRPKVLFGPDDHHLKTRLESLLEAGTGAIKLPSMQSIRTEFEVQ